MSTLKATIARWLQRKHFGTAAIAAFRTGLAATLCLFLGHLFGLQHSYWAAISAIVVMGSDTGVTIASGRDRIVGTAVGATLGWGACYLWGGHYLLYGLAVAVCLFVCAALTSEKAGRLAGVALTIVVLLRVDDSPGRAALARFLEVGLGIVVALVVTLVVFPKRGLPPANDTAPTTPGPAHSDPPAVIRYP
jgi:uncharacterized membrane protein YccC